MRLRYEIPGPRERDRPMVDAARHLTLRLIGDDQERLHHSEAVAARAHALTATVAEEDAGSLVAAAWLHDVGYAPGLMETGFHPLDGARFLRRAGWDPLVCNLVAHHSGSRFVAHVRGLDVEFAPFAFRESPLSDALTVADQTVGPDGRPLSLEARMCDMLERHGPDSAQARAHPERQAYLRATLQRVETRLTDAGSDDLPTWRQDPAR